VKESSNIYTTILSVCPIRIKPDDTSELVSQLLFGETVSIQRKYKSNWVEVISTHDDYSGWMDPKQLIKTSSEQSGSSVCLDIAEPVFADKSSTLVTLGASLPDYDGITCKVGGRKFRFSGQAKDQLNTTINKDFVQRLAKKLLNTPYLWGGRSPLGIDCSGFTQVIYKCCGIAIKRDAKDQATQGETIDFVNSAQPGDLAFFSTSSDKITHVGIVMEDQKIIHAHGCVRMDALDHYGIFNQDIQEYTHRLKIIKRYF